ncbi:hypothetical protein GMAR_ORF231 [Golden Marseillevirus]|uniref:hypothetical protein n=1 Tax=Golden Marseillevirus TaxID=1720526 RepID=UPI000877AB34|nr:hypothetical protein GMAR_ORF231 [Golden Marseillevirus]ALX27605.1 hypothetical protein GMAR_ORF231 [Golden Marseillevirus]
MATKTLLSENLYSIESEDDFLLTVDGEALAMVKGKKNAEKAVIVIVEKRESELKDAYTRVSREKIQNGFAILTQALGYVMNGSPVQKHVIKFISLPSLSFEEEEKVEEPPKVNEIPPPPPNPLEEQIQKALPEIPPEQKAGFSFVGEKIIPYNSSEYDAYPSAY